MRSFYKVWTCVYEGEGDDAAAKAAADAAAKAAVAGKTFTQDDVNRILAKEKRDFQTKQQQMADELEALKQKSTLSDEERTALETRIETLRTESLSKEELAKREKDKILKLHETEKTSLTGERDLWKSRYTDASIVRSISDAASEFKSYRPSQIVAILRPNTRLVEALDDAGKPSGNFIAKVTLSDVDKEGKPVTLDVSVSDAVKRMKEMEEYANLFISEGTGGVGGSTRNSGGKELSKEELAKDPVKYREARKKGLI